MAATAPDAGSLRTVLLPAPLAVGECRLPSEEAHHLCRVLRLGAGEPLRVIDGAGREGRAELVLDAGAPACRVQAVDERPPPACAQLAVAVAAPKGSRFEDLVRGLTELGVGEIAPLECRRAVRQPRLQRAERSAREALKQCGRVHLPRLGPTRRIGDLAADGSRLILADPEGGAVAIGDPRPTRIVIGPEGGFTAEERDQLFAAGAEPLRLAGHVLRIETAALAAAAVWIQAWEHADA